jgi:DNA-binding transcriptional ArsR family regulator
VGRSKESKSPAPGRFAYEGLERAIHEKARLGIMTSLMTRPEGLSFNELKELCDLTDGNLNRHLEVLSEAGLITIRKEEGSGRGRTLCKITATGRTRFKEYLEELERVIADAAVATAVNQRLQTT